jgi:hypothetical protein
VTPILGLDERQNIQRRRVRRKVGRRKPVASLHGISKKSGFTVLVKPPVACFVRFPSADHGSVPVTWYTAMQPFASTPPPDVQIAGTDCPVKAVLAIGT